MPLYECTITPTDEQRQQYYAIRKTVFRDRMFVLDYTGLPDDLDHSGTMMLIVNEDQHCVGGVLLHHRSLLHDVPLPIFIIRTKHKLLNYYLKIF